VSPFGGLRRRASGGAGLAGLVGIDLTADVWFVNFCLLRCQLLQGRCGESPPARLAGLSAHENMLVLVVCLASLQANLETAPLHHHRLLVSEATRRSLQHIARRQSGRIPDNTPPGVDTDEAHSPWGTRELYLACINKLHLAVDEAMELGSTLKVRSDRACEA
jgi:hypothetical protein